MGEAKGQDDKRPKDQGPAPTRSFDGSTPGRGGQIGPFRIERELGRGAVGVVYLAHDTKLDRSVAIKSLPAEVMANPKARSRFSREARLLASVNHPNIATIHEVLEEAEGIGYLVLEYVPGQTLAERIAGARLKLDEALSIALQIAEAIAAAHKHGVIHRDLKPVNIKITPEGKVKVLDFGLAKVVGGQAADQHSTITEPGRVIGTPAYMSPEQARGKLTDKRTDIWSFGCVLYEMLTGRLPFEGETVSDTLANILQTDPDWQALPPETGPQVRSVLYKCLEKDPDSRYQSAAQIRQDLYSYQATLSAKAFDVRLAWRAVRRPRVAVCIILILLTLGFGLSRLMHHRSKVRWGRFEAIPEIERLIEQDKYLAAFAFACQAEKYIAKEPMLIELWPRIARSISILTTPRGADIFFKEYTAIDGQWQYLGRSPLENIRFPNGFYRWQMKKEGFETRECVLGGYTDRNKPYHFELHEEGSLTPGMVLIPAEDLRRHLDDVNNVEAAQASAYLIDKHEVTNQQFKEFVDKGGYQNRDYWKNEFVKEGSVLSREQAMAEFRDKMGRLGPSMWEGGTYPKGQEKYPVSGVSWHEADAYAQYAGKSLPTTYHWFTAARREAAVIVPLSNLGGEGPAPVGSHPGIGRNGLYDMAGNVKEWCWNATNYSAGRRYILGGAWGEQTYMFSNKDARSAWDRSPVNGFRCVQYPDGQDSVPEGMFDPVERRVWRDYSSETPVSDEEFQFFKKLYAYDQTELNAVAESVDDSSRHWRKEKITFDAAYGGERVIAYLFLPKGVKPPYQTVVYFPGSNAHLNRSFENLWEIPFTEFLIMSGRAVLYPIYKGTCERQIVGGYISGTSRPIAHRDWIIQMSKDLGRSVDYLEDRDDIDSERIAYYGMSWGASLGPIMLAVEDRIKVGILVVGGFLRSKRPLAADPFDFAPRVRIPVLMVNGKQDYTFPFETSQRPMYELLGTPDEDKTHKVYPGGHGLMGIFFRQIRGDVLGWLDRYLGPVD